MLRAHAALARARRARRVRASPFSTAEAQPAVHVGLLFAEHFSFSAEDVAVFARLTGDTNPIHSDTVRSGTWRVSAHFVLQRR